MLTSAYCTKYKDSYESAHLLSAGLYHYVHPSPLAPAAGTPDSSTHSSTDSSTVYIYSTLEHSAPRWLSTELSLSAPLYMYSHANHNIQQWLEDATELGSLHTQLTDSAGKVAESGSR